MNKFPKMYSTNMLFRKVKQKQRASKNTFIDQDAFFKVQTIAILLMDIHHMAYNSLDSGYILLYIAASVSIGLEFLLFLVWRKKKFLTPILLIIALGIFNWVHICFLIPDYFKTSSQYSILQGLPMAVINLVTIQNLSHFVYKTLAIAVWLGMTIFISFDNNILVLFPMLFIMLCFIFVNFMLIRKKLDDALNNEHKITRTMERMRTLLDTYINDGVIVVDVSIKHVLFSNNGFVRLFEARDNGDDHAKAELRFILTKVLVEEEGAKNTEPIYLWELLDVLRENMVEETYETTCKYQLESGKYRTLVGKISQCSWDSTKAFVLVFTDISQQETLKELTASGESQDHMLDVFSHELRTPIRNILGALDLLVKDSVLNQLTQNETSVKKYINICQLSCKYLQALSNTYLDVARLRHHALKISTEIFSLPKLLSDVKDMLECQASEKGLKIEVDLLPEVPEKIINDKEKLEQILLNLLTNSIKFTFSGDIRIEVCLDAVYPDSIEISVIDSGTGIRKTDKGNLFRTFTLMKKDKKANPDGVGLGLSISQKLTRALAEHDDLRGIRVESLVGKGSRFTFSIASYRSKENFFNHFHNPMLPDERDQDNVSISMNQSVQKVKTAGRPPKLIKGSNIYQATYDPFGVTNDLVLDKTNSILQSANPSSAHDIYTDQDDNNESPNNHASPHPNHAQMLVVDDNTLDLMLICQQLDGMKINYKSVLSGDACLEEIDEATRQNHLYKCILLDLYMPDLTGFQTAKILKARMARKEIPEIPIIAISAHDNQDNRERAFRTGMVGWYTKPLKLEDVQELSEKYLKVWKPVKKYPENLLDPLKLC